MIPTGFVMIDLLVSCPVVKYPLTCKRERPDGNLDLASDLLVNNGVIARLHRSHGEVIIAYMGLMWGGFV